MHNLYISMPTIELRNLDVTIKDIIWLSSETSLMQFLDLRQRQCTASFLLIVDDDNDVVIVPRCRCCRNTHPTQWLRCKARTGPTISHYHLQPQRKPQRTCRQNSPSPTTKLALTQPNLMLPLQQTCLGWQCPFHMHYPMAGILPLWRKKRIDWGWIGKLIAILVDRHPYTQFASYSSKFQ